MGEIKSTLELIMEKTKGLSMTQEEKEAFRLEEWLKKSRGWIQKYLDDLEDLEKVKRALIGENDLPKGWEQALKKEIVAGLDLDKDAENERRFRLLAGLLGISADPFQRTLRRFKEKALEEAGRLAVADRERLAERGVSGSAVLPNPDRWPAWKQFYQEQKKVCREALAAL